MYLLLALLFGSPEAAYVARARTGIEALVPCLRDAHAVTVDRPKLANDARARMQSEPQEHPGVIGGLGLGAEVVHEGLDEGRVLLGGAEWHPPILPVSCQARHRLAAWAIGVVAAADHDPDSAIAILTGAGVHETRFAVDVEQGREQVGAVSWFQLEVPARDRARYLADPVLAATRALVIARTCGGSMRGYATGRCDGPDGAASELRHDIARGREATR